MTEQIPALTCPGYVYTWTGVEDPNSGARQYVKEPCECGVRPGATGVLTAGQARALLERYYDEEWGFQEDAWRFVRDLRATLGIERP